MRDRFRWVVAGGECILFAALALAAAPQGANPNAPPKGQEAAKKDATKKDSSKPKGTAPKVYPPLLDCVEPGATELYGKLSVPAAAKDFRAERNYQALVLDGDPIVTATGIFTIKLKRSLEQRLLPGNAVRVTVAGASADREVGICPASIAVPVAVAKAPEPQPPPDPAPAAVLPPRILEPLVEGQQTLQVQLHAPGAVIREVHVNEQKVAADIHLPNQSGVARVDLPNRLVAHKEVQVLAPPGPPSARVEVTEKEPADPSPGNAAGGGQTGDSKSADAGVAPARGGTSGTASRAATKLASSQQNATPGQPQASNSAAQGGGGDPQNKPADDNSLPTLLGALHAGDTKLDVTVRKAGVTQFQVIRNGKSLDHPIPITKDPPADAKPPLAVATDEAAGKYTITLADPLKENQTVQVVPLDDNGNQQQKPTDSMTVDIGLQPPKVATLKEGDKTVSGMVTDSAATGVHVVVFDHNGGVIEEKSGSLQSSSKTFVVGLTRVLAEDDTVDVTSTKPNLEGPVTHATVETSEYNWGRVRAYFSIGASSLASSSTANDNSFTKMHPDISLNVDKNWFHWLRCYQPRYPSYTDEEKKILSKAEADRTPAEREILKAKQQLIEEVQRKYAEADIRLQRLNALAPPPYEDSRWRCDNEPFRQQRWHILLNTYTEFRLQSADAFDFTGVKTDTLKTAAKVGHFEFGAYLPISHAKTSWRFDGQRQALFIAPLVKGGLETVPVAAPSTNGQLTLDGRDNYKFLAGGVRFGHYRAYSNSHSVAPLLISWVDFTWGRWDRMLRGDYPPKSVPMRFEATGRMKIPYTPFTIGFTSNTGPGHDEFALFAGMRFDLSRVLAKIAPNIQ